MTKMRLPARPPSVAVHKIVWAIAHAPDVARAIDDFLKTTGMPRMRFDRMLMGGWVPSSRVHSDIACFALRRGIVIPWHEWVPPTPLAWGDNPLARQMVA